MKRESKNNAEHTVRLRLWTYEEASKALPYLRGVAQSIREHWLEMQQAKHRIRRIDARHGRVQRDAMIERAEAAKAADRAEDEFEAGVNELLELSIYVLDPTQGQALIPFRQGDELAWYVFDLFAPEGVESWRFHQDPVEMRRPLPAEAAKPGTLLAAM
jgi:hypothetical protein